MAMPDMVGGAKPWQSKFRLVRGKSADPVKPKPSPSIDALHERWFFALEPKYFVKLQQEWNESNLNIKLENHDNYDSWLNYFKTLPPNTIRMLAKTGLDILPTEAYAALSMWHDIISNPHRINKIHQSGLTNPKTSTKGKTIIELAHSNDRLGVLKATRDKLAEKLDKGAGNRDTALLVREMTDVMTQIADYERRAGPAKHTELAKLLSENPGIKNKRPAKNGGGSRNTSFKTRVTIDDLKGDD